MPHPHMLIALQPIIGACLSLGLILFGVRLITGLQCEVVLLEDISYKLTNRGATARFVRVGLRPCSRTGAVYRKLVLDFSYAQSNTSLILPEADDLDLNGLALLEDIAWLLHSLTGNLRNVDQALYTRLQLDKRSEVS